MRYYHSDPQFAILSSDAIWNMDVTENHGLPVPTFLKESTCKIF